MKSNWESETECESDPSLIGSYYATEKAKINFAKNVSGELKY